LVNCSAQDNNAGGVQSPMGPHCPKAAAKGPSINDVSSKGVGGQKCRNLLSKHTTKREGGDGKIRKMDQRCLCMAPNAIITFFS
jgi:hypothetical protein